MENLYEKLHYLYPVQKTLKFELIPIGKTKENLEKDGILKEDEHRAQIYQKVKCYLDEYHKYFIEKCLEDVKLTKLEEYARLYTMTDKNDKQKEEFLKIQKLLRKEISDAFQKNKEEFENLFSKTIVEESLKNFYQDDLEKRKEIEEFKGFTTYFTGYHTNRKNLYSDEEKSSSIAYRLIHENLPTFLWNIKIYQKIFPQIAEGIQNIEKELKEELPRQSLAEVFTLDFFQQVLTQKGIESYNIIISGKSEENGNKIKGINEYINEYNQTHTAKIPRLKELYKQMLSDKIGSSFVIEKIDNDKELVSTISDYYFKLKEMIANKIINLEDIFSKGIQNDSAEKIYLNYDSSLQNISNDIFEEWSYIQKALDARYDRNYTGKLKTDSENYKKQRKNYWKEKSVFSVAYLEECLSEYDKENTGKIIKYLSHYLHEEKLVQKMEESYQECKLILEREYDEKSKNLMKNDQEIEKIKQLLDTIKAIQEFVKIVIPKDKTVDLDESFYSDIGEIYDVLSEVVPLYNKVRNYLTQKPYSNEKIKLNFQTPTFLNGWDRTKEKENLGVLLKKGDNYYLGILTKKDKKIFEKEHQAQRKENTFQKMEYKLLQQPSKMLPKVFFSKSGKEKFCPSDTLLKKYQEGIFKKGENFDLDFCHELIAFYQQAISQNQNWQCFHFQFKDSKQYQDISEFYTDVERQGYHLEFSEFSEEYIYQLVEEGRLYLFQIYNKDFSPFSKGRPNLHTMYWKALFQEENLKDVTYKLNGEGEVFYRKSSLQLSQTTIHPANQPIKNKNENVSKKTSLFSYDLIKDRRYTVDKFQFHVPITMNFKNQKISNLNGIVNQYLKYHEDIHIIGIDRGERNLIYVTVINSKGNIVYQQSMNEIVSKVNEKDYKTDYHRLLTKREEENENARKSWKTIGNIKELKEGYMSQVIHKVIELTKQYPNAIIVMEDLNKGFKNARKKVEKQVYQKFEQMLIQKLNYVVDKEKKPLEDGGVLKAYQLTNEFQSFQKLGKQTGILFYIPAWCTSKIDPTTGFINLLFLKNESLESSKTLIQKIDSICYHEIEDMFEFTIDYAKFSQNYQVAKTKWKVYANGERIRTFRNKNSGRWENETVNLTKEWKKLFEEYQIDFNHMKEEILEKADAKFFHAVKEQDGFYGFTILLKLVMQMRNSITGEMEDYLISPVKNHEGKFFCTKESDMTLPRDADANGAYHIARKGLMLVNRIRQTKDEDLKKISYGITNTEWLNFVQSEGDK